CYYHDSAAVLIADGRIIAAAEEERFTRRKHDASFPEHAVAFVLMKGGITARDVDVVAFYDKPLLKLERIICTSLHCAPRGFRRWMDVLPDWAGSQLKIKSAVRKALPDLRDDAEFIFAGHHESHAAAAFYPSPFKASAFLTVDGVGEWATTTFGF